LHDSFDSASFFGRLKKKPGQRGAQQNKASVFRRFFLYFRLVGRFFGLIFVFSIPECSGTQKAKISSRPFFDRWY